MLTKEELKQAQEFINQNKIESNYFFYNTTKNNFTLDFNEVRGKNFITLKAYNSKLEGYAEPGSKYYPSMNMLKYKSLN